MCTVAAIDGEKTQTPTIARETQEKDEWEKSDLSCIGGWRAIVGDNREVF